MPEATIPIPDIPIDQADQAALWVNVHEWAAIDHPTNRIRHVAHGLGQQFARIRIIVQHTEFEAFCKEAERVLFCTRATDDFNVGNTSVH